MEDAMESPLRAHETLDVNEPKEAKLAYRAFERARTALSKLKDLK